MYRWDNCRDPQNDPNCPGYIAPLPVMPVIEIYDALDDDNVDKAIEETDSELYNKEKEESKDTEEEEEEKGRLEIALAASENALTIANTSSQASLLRTINRATNINAYYSAQISGKIYTESITLQDREIVDNKKVFRSLTQDKLHNEMIQEQYQ
jgi:hypothetical protein